jgi:cardiolipin synthase (CMP-forming)
MMPLTFANKITIGRILAVPFLIATLLYYAPERDNLRLVALGIFLFAVISDVVDGYIARTRHQKTPAGIILDPLADKLLLISAFLCLYVIRGDLPVVRFPLWLVVAVISRDVILLIGGTLIYLTHGNFFIEATRWGKASTFFQVVTVITLLLQWTGLEMLWIVTVFFVFISAVDYLRQGVKLLNLAQHPTVFSFNPKAGKKES